MASSEIFRPIGAGASVAGQVPVDDSRPKRLVFQVSKFQLWEKLDAQRRLMATRETWPDSPISLAPTPEREARCGLITPISAEATPWPLVAGGPSEGFPAVHLVV